MGFSKDEKRQEALTNSKNEERTKKSKKTLFLGLVVGLGVVIAALLLVILLPSGDKGPQKADKFLISYELNGGTAENPTEYSENDSLTLVQPIRQGYTFWGWTGTELEDRTIEVIIPEGSSGNRQYTANWVANKYFVVLDAAGGEVSGAKELSFIVDYDEPCSLPTPIREHYSFLGWYEGATEYSDDKWNMTEDIVLTAKWEPVVYTISYELNGGTIEGEKKTTFTVEDLPVQLPEPSKFECEFLVWETGQDKKEKILSVTEPKDIVVSASYKNTHLLYGIPYTGATHCFISGYTGTAKVLDIPEEIDGLIVRYINDGALGYKNTLEEIVIPSSVTKIGDRAFKNSASLKTVKFSGELESIGEEVFSGCTSLEKINIPNGVTRLGKNAFYDCISLREITIPNTIVSIGEAAFYNATLLKEIIFPDSVTTIGENAFYGCVSLEKIEMPNNLSFLGIRAFSGCEMLQKIDISGTIGTINARTFDDCKNLREVKLSDTIVKIDQSAFSGCSSLMSIELPEGLKWLGDDAFRGCSSLADIEIPGGVGYLSPGVFYGCTNLENVILNEGIETIEHNVFTSTKITKLIIPESVYIIRSGAFKAGYNSKDPDCENIKFYCRREKRPQYYDDGWNLGHTVIWGYTGN